MDTRWAIVLFILALCLSGCFESAQEKQREIAQGKTLFELRCCGCHNGKLSNVARVPPDLSGLFERSTLPSGAPSTDAQVRSTIEEGRAEIMPSFRDSLSDADIGDIIRYLHSVNAGTSACATD
jgi:mono/diheme cytochrome c family protein